VGRSARLRTDARGTATLSGLPGCACRFEASPPEKDDAHVATGRSVVVPNSGPIEIRLRRGVRIRGKVLIPVGVVMPVRVVVKQRNDGGIDEQAAEITDGNRPTFSLLLDPDDGAIVAVGATAGPEEAPTHRAKAEGSALASDEIVLTLTAVK
jgi:hypothetical protein